MGNTKQRVTIFIDKFVVKKSKAQAIIDEVTLSSFIESTLVKCLPKEIKIKKT